MTIFEIILVLLLVALLAGALGARKTSETASNIAWALFVIGLIIWLIQLIV